MRLVLSMAAVLGAAAPAYAQDSLVSIGDPAYLANDSAWGHVTVLRYPTLGLPEIVRAGNVARAILKLPSADGATVTITATGDSNPYTRTLNVTGATPDAATGTTTLTFAVPADVPADTYDLSVTVASQGVADGQPNCFRVVAEESSTFTYVVVADPQFNDPRGVMSPGNRNPNNYNVYGIVQQIKKELRALNPTFAILCGDLLFGIDYDYEYEGAWNLWKDTGVPIFMVPGNHDGYASTETRTLFGITSPQRDGLEHWRRHIGPNYFSFEFGGLHFQGVNSYDGSAARRDTFLIVVENYGGDLTQAQMDWIASDLAGVPLVVPFLHHNPLGPYRANVPFSITWFILSRIITFLTGGSIEDMGQTWNSQATADFLKTQYAGKAPFIWIGHEHHDQIETYAGQTYKLVTDAATGGSGYWGYALVEVTSGAVTSFLYNGASEQSIPAGNLHVAVTGSQATVTSGLARAYEVTIEFLVPQAPSYVAVNGTVVASSPVGGGQSRVWVRAASPVAASIDSPASTTVALEFTATAPPDGGSSGGGGGCGSTGAAGSALPFLATLAALLLGRRLAR